MTYTFSKTSITRLAGVHTDLARVAKRALELSEVDFGITEGRRTLVKQKEYFAAGATTTMNSRHLTGHAIDVVAYVNGKVRWDWPLYHKIAAAMKQAAQELNVPIEWGGDWKKFKDGPHFQLPWKVYP